MKIHNSESFAQYCALGIIVTVSPQLGVWWLGIWRWRLILRSPRDLPLFSERYGHTKTLRLGGGWRLQSRLVPR